MLSWRKSAAVTLGGALVVGALAGPVMASAKTNSAPEQVAFSVAGASGGVSLQKQKELLEDVNSKEFREDLVTGLASRLDKSESTTVQALSKSLQASSSSKVRASSSSDKLTLSASRLADLVKQMSTQLGVPP
jgi:hypothetical protein